MYRKALGLLLFFSIFGFGMAFGQRSYMMLLEKGGESLGVICLYHENLKSSVDWSKHAVAVHNALDRQDETIGFLEDGWRRNRRYKTFVSFLEKDPGIEFHHVGSTFRDFVDYIEHFRYQEINEFNRRLGSIGRCQSYFASLYKKVCKYTKRGQMEEPKEALKNVLNWFDFLLKGKYGGPYKKSCNICAVIQDIMYNESLCPISRVHGETSIYDLNRLHDLETILDSCAFIPHVCRLIEMYKQRKLNRNIFVFVDKISCDNSSFLFSSYFEPLGYKLKLIQYLDVVGLSKSAKEDMEGVFGAIIQSAIESDTVPRAEFKLFDVKEFSIFEEQLAMFVLRVVKSCAGCGKNCKKLSACGKCGLAAYCSINCQKTYWKKHKEICSKICKKNKNNNRCRFCGIPLKQDMLIECRSAYLDGYCSDGCVNSKEERDSRLERERSNEMSKKFNEKMYLSTIEVPFSTPSSRSKNPIRYVDKYEVAACEFCGRNDVELFKCSRCRSVMYCNRKCQKADWKRHKKTCKRGDHV